VQSLLGFFRRRGQREIQQFHAWWERWQKSEIELAFRRMFRSAARGGRR
jgi:hypothetical protein